MPLQILLFLLGLVTLLLSTSYLVNTSEKLAYKFKISPLVVGIVLLSFGTTLPEFAVSGIAVFNGDYGLAIGNVMGSNIVNVIFILGVGILFGGLRIGTTKTQKAGLIVLILSFLFFALNYFKISHLTSGLLLITVGIFVTFMEYRWGKQGSKLEDLKRLSLFHKKVKFTKITALLLLLSLVGIFLGGLLVVNSTEHLSLLLGYSTTVLGLSLTAVSTSMPEMLTMLFSLKEKDEKLTLGNIIGSNTYNLAIIGGISLYFGEHIAIPGKDWIWFLGTATLLFLVIKIYKGKVIPFLLGIAFLGLMIFYLHTLSLI